MTRKTLEDCVKCSHVSICDAHVTNGSHPHRKGADPCDISLAPIIDADRMNREILLTDTYLENHPQPKFTKEAMDTARYALFAATPLREL